MIRRAIDMSLCAIPVAIIGAISDHYGGTPNVIVGLMTLTAIVVCGLTEWRAYHNRAK